MEWVKRRLKQLEQITRTSDEIKRKSPEFWEELASNLREAVQTYAAESRRMGMGFDRLWASPSASTGTLRAQIGQERNDRNMHVVREVTFELSKNGDQIQVEGTGLKREEERLSLELDDYNRIVAVRQGNRMSAAQLAEYYLDPILFREVIDELQARRSVSGAP